MGNSCDTYKREGKCMLVVGRKICR